jgi:hypothetical protein
MYSYWNCVYYPELPPFNVQKAENGPEKAENDRNSTAKKQEKKQKVFSNTKPSFKHCLSEIMRDFNIRFYSLS